MLLVEMLGARKRVLSFGHPNALVIARNYRLSDIHGWSEGAGYMLIKRREP